MRDIRLSDGSDWRLETDGGASGRARDRGRQRLYVWVACTSLTEQRRLMFAPDWERWPRQHLRDALEREIEREHAWKEGLKLG